MLKMRSFREKAEWHEFSLHNEREKVKYRKKKRENAPGVFFHHEALYLQRLEQWNTVNIASLFVFNEASEHNEVRCFHSGTIICSAFSMGLL
uniref:Pepsin inhibitor-3-like repeated domain-containing protein n=1 Tax=Parascaris univalens TaxID=6257 RepID=A0A915A8R3_PARUN